MTYKYLTQDIIRSGRFTAASAEQYREAVEYNNMMSQYQMMKGRLLAARDVYGLLYVVAYLMSLCLFLKPIIFKGVGGINLAAAFIAGGGYFYLLLRYIIPDFGSNDTIVKLPAHRVGGKYGGRGTSCNEIRTGASFGTIAALILGFVMVLISVIVLKDRYTVNMGVSAAALALCTAFLIFFVFRRERWNLWFSVMSAAAFLLINPVVSVYAVLIIAVSALVDKFDRDIRDKEGYPDFVPLTVTTTYEGSKMVRSYDDFNRFDGIDDEMESI